MKNSVLIVDDDIHLLERLRQTFEAGGWDVVVAHDGEEVFRVFTAYNPQAMLLDVYMPKIDGSDVCRLIKGHPSWKETYLVIMSSRISETDRERFANMGADQILPKPFEPQQALALCQQGLINKERAAGILDE